MFVQDRNPRLPTKGTWEILVGQEVRKYRSRVYLESSAIGLGYSLYLTPDGLWDFES